MKILILTLCWSGAGLPPNCALFIGKTEEGEASGDSESKHSQLKQDSRGSAALAEDLWLGSGQLARSEGAGS